MPLTGKEVVDVLITEMAVFEFDKETREMTLTEIAEDTRLEDVIAQTGTKFKIA